MKSILSALFFSILLYAQAFCQEERYHIYEDSSGACGYRNSAGEIIIAANQYSMCFTDTFTHFAAVFSEKEGLIGINNSGKVLFQIFSYDNGPDPLSEGLFRIIKDHKIGFADSTGEIIIAPVYSCAYPFKNSRAKVSFNCIKRMKGEHSLWESKDWIYIDKSGNPVK